jgi:hypothetical protein
MIQIDSSSSLTSLNRWLSTGVLRVFRVFLFLCKRRTETDTCFSWHAHAPYGGLVREFSYRKLCKRKPLETIVYIDLALSRCLGKNETSELEQLFFEPVERLLPSFAMAQ